MTAHEHKLPECSCDWCIESRQTVQESAPTLESSPARDAVPSTRRVLPIRLVPRVLLAS